MTGFQAIGRSRYLNLDDSQTAMGRLLEVGAQFPAGLCGVGVGFQVHLPRTPATSFRFSISWITLRRSPAADYRGSTTTGDPTNKTSPPPCP